MIPVYAIETSEGWILQTADDERDTLAGPLLSEKDIRAAAKESDLKIITTQVLSTNLSLRVGKRSENDLFRIDNQWYRFKSRSGDVSKVHVVGTDKDCELQNDTEITEISVLSKGTRGL